MIESPRIAIVGVGSIGSKHIDNLLAMGYEDLVGIDPRPMPHDERLPIVDAFEDVEWWKPTHALICSPPDWHYHHAKYFVDRGIPTLIEKPMTVSRVEASELCATAHMNKSILAVGYMERAHPEVLRAKEFIKKHGCVKAEICCYWQATEKTYKLNTEQESSHAIDLAIFLLGPSMFVTAHSENTEMTIRADFESMATCVIRMNMNEWPRRIINLIGKDGEWFSSMYGESKDEWASCYQEELTAFLAGQPLCTGEDGLRVVEILEGMK